MHNHNLLMEWGGPVSTGPHPLNNLLDFFIFANEHRPGNVVHFHITDIPDKDDVWVLPQHLHHLARRWEVNQRGRLLIARKSIKLAGLIAHHDPSISTGN